jgi:microcystin-dependent protein
MAYTITKSDGSTLTTIADGYLDSTHTGLSLPGPNYVGYGRILNQNLVFLLENFASNSTPLGTSLQGQLWFNKSTQTLNVYTNQGYLPVAGVTNSGTQPVQSKTGDIWFNTGTNQTFLFDNGAYKLIGPGYTKQQGISGAIPVTVTDGVTSSITHDIIQLQFGNIILATFNNDTAFQPATPISGFPTINSGITLNNSISNSLLNTNIVGDVTGRLTGDVTGNVVATTLRGTLIGNVTGNVTATTVTAGTITGVVTTTSLSATAASITSLTTGNATITGGTITGVSNLTADTSTITNLYSGNTTITGGTITGITNLNTVFTSAGTLVTANAQITGGAMIGIANLTAVTSNIGIISSNIITTGNIVSSNARITGGNITGITTFQATTGSFTNLSVANLVISSGSTTNAIGTFVNLFGTNFSTGNALITSANINNVTMSNVTANAVTLTSATATTQAVTTRNTTLATTAFVHSVMPTGMIVMWGGLTVNIPAGWQLCNGESGVPDLRDLFIVGAGAAYPVGSTGGLNTVTLNSTQIPSHAHTFTITGNTALAGSHNHTLRDPGHKHTTGQVIDTTIPGLFRQSTGNIANGSGTTFTTGNIGTGVSMDGVSDHRHTISISDVSNPTGDDQPHENRPPYYALCYIQKIA